MPPLVAHPSAALAAPGCCIGPVYLVVPRIGAVELTALVGPITNLPRQPGPPRVDGLSGVLAAFSLS